jgi:hypothetical protein
MIQPTKVLLLKSLSELAKSIPRTQPNLLVLLGCDARALRDVDILAALRQMFEQGIVYLCCWGSDCERVHDLADQLTLHQLGDDLVLTTWHDDESLDEAIWFLIHCAEPANEKVHSKCDQVVAIVNDENLYRQAHISLEEMQCVSPN